MVGAGEAFFAAYTLDLGFSELQAAIIVTIPLVIGGIIQMFAPKGINKLASFERWTLTGVFLQSLLFLLFILFDYQMKNSYALLFFIVVLYWSLALGASPSWNSWMAGLLAPDQIRRFFSNRNIIMAIGTLVGLCLSGLTLEFMHETYLGLRSFDWIFLACFVFRFLSFVSLYKHERVSFQPIESTLNFRLNGESEFIRKFIFFSSVFKMGVFFSASFFAPYMLKKLGFSYLQFMLILSSAYGGRVILGQLVKKYLKNHDINLVYLFSAIGIAFIPIVWTFFKDFMWIFYLEIFTGLLWGAFEVSFLVICFEEIPANKQAKIMTWYNLLHTSCIALGSILGLLCFYKLGNHIESYYLIFVTSGILRLSSICFFPRKKVVNGTVVVADFTRSLAVRPNMGSITRPVWQVYKKAKERYDKRGLNKNKSHFS